MEPLTKKKVSQQVFCPAFTNDYRVVSGKCGGEGLGMVANRFIAKGDPILLDSLEFLFSDVEDGDSLRLHNHEMASLAARYEKGEGPVPELYPITKEMLLQTHGVPTLIENSDEEDKPAETWRLEVPWMLMNHSCDPSTIDSSHKEPEGEAIAARDLYPGDELTYDYTHQLFCHRHSFTCLCGAEKCRGIFAGFQALDAQDKEKTLPRVSEYIRARHEGVQIENKQAVFDTRDKPHTENNRSNVQGDDNVIRLVFPGPSCSDSDVLVKQNAKTAKLGLYAMRDFDRGELVYSFWNQQWPGNAIVDMVAATQLRESDLPEGTVARMIPEECAFIDCQGQNRFSGYDMFRTHSCDPNTTYNHKTEGEDDEWRSVYAVKPIRKGELLTQDFNTIWWDRSTAPSINSSGICDCGAFNCRGTANGFKFVSKDGQDELKAMSLFRELPPYPTGRGGVVRTGEVLAPHIQIQMRLANSEKHGNPTSPLEYESNCLFPSSCSDSESETSCMSSV
ncbi:PostSET [Seminavis robusta]|uniref:PostSET n=1 Tax=Seminavis robusta TaxID=568900 RepID=A0A9N8EJE0_9STRA|nr:PostSET [Seminavis robusta]|eukprot:Sro1095_g240690.1 PostSET (506) ;mRNA; f:23142-24659